MKISVWILWYLFLKNHKSWSIENDRYLSSDYLIYITPYTILEYLPFGVRIEN